MLHGAGGGAWEWQVWRRVFEAAGIRCVVAELQPAATGLAGTRLSDYASQVNAHLDGLPSPRILVGASLGGLLAAMFADRADALILINPLPAAPLHREMPPRPRYPWVIPWATQATLAGTRRSLFDADEAACLFAFRHWRDESGAALDDAFAGITVPPVSCPAWMIVSGRDDDIPPALSLRAAAAMGAVPRLLPDASHVGPLLGRDAATIAAESVANLNALFLHRAG